MSGIFSDEDLTYTREIDAAEKRGVARGGRRALRELEAARNELATLRASLQTAREDGAREREEMIVAWLRSVAPVIAYNEAIGGTELTVAADALARGAHREKP